MRQIEISFNRNKAQHQFGLSRSANERIISGSRQKFEIKNSRCGELVQKRTSNWMANNYNRLVPKKYQSPNLKTLKITLVSTRMQ